MAASSSSSFSPEIIYVRTDQPNVLLFLYEWILHSDGLARYAKETCATHTNSAVLVDQMIRECFELLVECANTNDLGKVESERVNFLTKKAYQKIVCDELNSVYQEGEKREERSLIIKKGDNEEASAISSDSVRAIPVSVLLVASCVDWIVRQAPETWSLSDNFESFTRNFGEKSSINLFEFWRINETCIDDDERKCTAGQLWMIVNERFFVLRHPATLDQTVYMHPDWKLANIVAAFVRSFAQTMAQQGHSVPSQLVASCKVYDSLYCRVPSEMFTAVLSAVHTKLGQGLDTFRKTRDNFI